jgi:hypothetical protein
MRSRVSPGFVTNRFTSAHTWLLLGDERRGVYGKGLCSFADGAWVDFGNASVLYAPDSVSVKVSLFSSVHEVLCCPDTLSGFSQVVHRLF